MKWQKNNKKARHTHPLLVYTLTHIHTLIKNPSLAWLPCYLDYFMTVLQLSHSSCSSQNNESEVRKKTHTNPTANSALPQETKFPKSSQKRTETRSTQITAWDFSSSKIIGPQLEYFWVHSGFLTFAGHFVSCRRVRTLLPVSVSLLCLDRWSFFGFHSAKDSPPTYWLKIALLHHGCPQPRRQRWMYVHKRGT